MGVLALFAGTAIAQNPLTMQLPGCEFTEYGGFVTTSEDTLWFTTLQSGAGTGLSFDGGAAETNDLFEPRSVPVGMLGGEINFDKKRAKTVLLFSVAPFAVQPWYSGSGRNFIRGGQTAAVESSLGLGYAWVDSTAMLHAAGPTSTIATKYPCQIMFSYVDSLHVAAVAAGDSVKVLVGY